MKLPDMLMALILIALGSFLFMVSYHHLNNSKATEKWVKHKGVVLNIDYERTSMGRRISNSPVVKYKYEVDGKTFRSNDREFPDGLEDEDIFGLYKKDNIIAIYYNPNKHAESSLFIGTNTMNYIFLCFSAIIAIVGLLFLFFIAIKAKIQSMNS